MSSIEKAIEKLKQQNKDSVKTYRNKTISSVELDNKPDSTISVSNSPEIQNIEKIVTKSTRSSSQKKIYQFDYQILSEHGFITPENANQTLLEEYRIIKRPLLNNAFNKGAALIENGNVITVVSSLPNEGKTFTALNLALSIAMEKDTTVLLIDADVTKPSLSKFLGLNQEAGLLDMLSDDNLDFADVVHKTNIMNLSILPAGRYNKQAIELISSERKNKFVSEISTRYKNRIVIFDAPPLLVASHSSILVDIAGQILFIVEEGKTKENVIREAISLIDEDKVIGMVLNKTHRVMSGDYYGTYGAVPGDDS